MTVPCHFGERQRTTKEARSFCSDKKGEKKHFSYFLSFPSFGTGHKSRKSCETPYIMLTLLVHIPRTDINAKQHFPYSFGKGKKS